MKVITLNQDNVLDILNPDKIYIAFVPISDGSGYFRLINCKGVVWFDQIGQHIIYTHLWMSNCVQYACEQFLKQPYTNGQLLQFNTEKEFNEWWEGISSPKELIDVMT
jgi:hypothetical protein